MSYSDIYNGPAKDGDTSNILLLKIWYRLQALVVAGGGGGVGGSTSSGLPYGADEQVLTNVVGGPGPTVIVYKKSGATVKTRTLTYTGSSPTDVLIGTVDT